MAIRILIADDQSLVRRSVAELIRDSGEDWVATARQLLARTADLFHSADIRQALRAPRFFCGVRGAAVPYCAKLHHANNKRRIFHHTQQQGKDHSF